MCFSFNFTDIPNGVKATFKMELDKIWKAYAKVNIFLKVVGVRENYHELSSRFVRVDNLYDEFRLEKKNIKSGENIVFLEKIMVLD